MVRRKKQPEKTRRSVLNAAGDEIARLGYAGSALGAIVERAGLTKGALFHHFVDKESLAVAWVGEVLEGALEEEWLEPMARVASLEEMQEFCRVAVREMDAGGTVATLVAVSAEMRVQEGRLRDALRAVLERWAGAVDAVFERGKAEGWIHPSIRPKQESDFFVAVVCGLAVTAGAAGEDSLVAYLETLRVV